MTKTAFLFPGQGSQFVGMGQDFYDSYPEIRDIFQQGSDICGRDLAALCFNGPMEELTRTVNLQPAIAAVNHSVFTLLKQRGALPDLCAGHSLGEYNALCAADFISAEDLFRLVCLRGRLMDREASRTEGKMVAVIGMPIQEVEQHISRVTQSGALSVANHNAEQQIVITGGVGPVDEASTVLKQAGARAIPLKVSGAWHSSLMEAAQAEFESLLVDVVFHTPQCPVILNVTGKPSDSPEAVKEIMARQLCSPVRWFDSMNEIVALGAQNIVETGPGKVLTGLARKTVPPEGSCVFIPVGNRDELESAVQQLA